MSQVPATRTRRRRTAFAPVAAGLVGFLLSVLFIQTGAWSTFDEYTHFDYVVKVAEDRRIPQVNELLGQTALQAAVCGRAPGFVAFEPACGADIIDPLRMPYGGASTATGYLPTYYVLTGVGAAVLHALPGDLSWLTAARLMGALYLALAAMLVVVLARRLGASSLVSFSAAVVVAAMPMVLLQFSTVNNDSLAVVLALAAVYVYLRMARSPVVARSIVGFALAFVAMTVKETALVAVLAIAVFSARDVLVERSRPGDVPLGLLRVIASTVIVVASVALLRTVSYPLLVGSLPDNGLQEDAIVAAQGTPPFNLVAGNALKAVPAALEVPEGALAGVWFAVAAQTLVLVALGLPLAALLRISRGRQWLTDRRLLSAVVVVGVPLFVALFLLQLRVSGAPAFFQPRYLLPLLVLAVAVAASFVRPQWWRLTVPVSLLLAVVVGVTLATGPQWTG